MRLEFFGNFFTEFFILNHAHSKLDEEDHTIALIYSIFVGVFTCGIVHATCAFIQCCVKPGDKNDKTTQKTDQTGLESLKITPPSEENGKGHLTERTENQSSENGHPLIAKEGSKNGSNADNKSGETKGQPPESKSDKTDSFEEIETHDKNSSSSDKTNTANPPPPDKSQINETQEEKTKRIYNFPSGMIKALGGDILKIPFQLSPSLNTLLSPISMGNCGGKDVPTLYFSFWRFVPEEACYHKGALCLQFFEGSHWKIGANGDNFALAFIGRGDIIPLGTPEEEYLYDRIGRLIKKEPLGGWKSFNFEDMTQAEDKSYAYKLPPPPDAYLQGDDFKRHSDRFSFYGYYERKCLPDLPEFFLRDPGKEEKAELQNLENHYPRWLETGLQSGYIPLRIHDSIKNLLGPLFPEEQYPKGVDSLPFCPFLSNTVNLKLLNQIMVPIVKGRKRGREGTGECGSASIIIKFLQEPKDKTTDVKPITLGLILKPQILERDIEAGKELLWVGEGLGNVPSLLKGQFTDEKGMLLPEKKAMFQFLEDLFKGQVEHEEYIYRLYTHTETEKSS